MRTLSLHATVVALGACLLAEPSRADKRWPSWLDPYARAEAGAAVPLRAPQVDYFTPGVGGRLSLGLGFGEWFGVQLTGQPVVLPARDTAPTSDPGVPIGVGGGVRFKLPYRFPVLPWLDGDLLYVRTGPLDRVGFTVGAGVHFALGNDRAWRMGPFVRFFDVVDQQSAHKLAADAMMFIGGLSIEVGRAHVRVLDRDGDGVADAEDRCPERAGLPANFGCPDQDHDGVVDALDRCVDLPGPAVTYGCPDSDGDGVYDPQDRCPRKPGPERFAGCPDTDGDNIADDEDRCPTQPGLARAGGCPDRDGDTVADGVDRCPDQPGTVAAGGCPDRDGDTVADSADRCPEQPGTASMYGCPDRDGDRVDDAHDRCPDQAGQLATDGCPDRDGDAVADADDQCPGERGPSLTHGCPDRDGDGVADREDQCMDVRGVAEKAGCPDLPAAVANGRSAELDERVYFAFDKANVTDAEQATLSAVVEVLQHYPELQLSLEGHADDRGSPHYNDHLSRDRADAVRGWFLARGIDPDRFVLHGWGSRRPAERDHTAEAHDRNRRVEFVLVQRARP